MVTAVFDRDANTYTLDVMVPNPKAVELIWLRLERTLTTPSDFKPCLKVLEVAPGDEARLSIELPKVADALTQLPRVRAFSHCGRHGAWASADLEVSGRRKDYLILKEMIVPEVVGDFDLGSPRDRT